MVTVREFPNQIGAALAQTFLGANGVDAVLADENAHAWIAAAALVPIRLQVPEEQAETARELLAQFDAASTGSDGT